MSSRRLRARPPFWIALLLILLATPILAAAADSVSGEPIDAGLSADSGQCAVVPSGSFPPPADASGILHLAYGCIPGGGNC